MSKHTYRNTSTRTLFIVNVGEIKAGATVKSDVEINHPALEPVTKSSKPKSEVKSKSKQEPAK